MASIPVLVAAAGGGHITPSAPTITLSSTGTNSAVFTIGGYNALYTYASLNQISGFTFSSGSGTATRSTNSLTVSSSSGVTTIAARGQKGGTQSPAVNVGVEAASYYTAPGTYNPGGTYISGYSPGPQTTPPCPPGWGNSWAQWPNGGTGGPVCVGPDSANYGYSPPSYTPGPTTTNPGPSGYTLSGSMWYRVY